MIRSFSKQIMLIATGLYFSGMTGHAETILAGWYKAGQTRNQNGYQSDITAADISAKVIFSGDSTPGTHWNTSLTQGSLDGTFGANSSGADTVPGVYMTDVEGAHMDFTITNNGDEPVELTTFCFDAWRVISDGYEVSVMFGDLVTDIAAGTFTAKKASPPAPPAYGDFENFDISLAGLPERNLAPGQSVTFRLKTVKRKGGGNLFFDNIAVCGTFLR
jgi:hypothetical protein